MQTKLTKYNLERVEKELKELEGKNIMVGDVWVSGVKKISFEYIPIDVDIPEEVKDGREENIIDIILELTDGRVSVSFCPDRQVCEVWFETDELLVFRIQDTNKYIESERYNLDFMQKEYDEYMNA